MFHCLPDSAGANGNLAEADGQLMKHPNQSQPNPGLRADGTPCIESTKSRRKLFSKVSSLLHDVEPAEHDHGVGKHEDVAGREEADVDVEVGQGNVAEAKRRLKIVVKLAFQLVCLHV